MTSEPERLVLELYISVVMTVFHGTSLVRTRNTSVLYITFMSCFVLFCWSVLFQCFIYIWCYVILCYVVSSYFVFIIVIYSTFLLLNFDVLISLPYFFISHLSFLSFVYYFLVLECSKFLKDQGESLIEVNCYDEISSSPSGGTIATIFHALNNR